MIVIKITSLVIIMVIAKVSFYLGKYHNVTC